MNSKAGIALTVCNKLRRALVMLHALWLEVFHDPVVVRASLAIGYDGKPLACNWGDDINYWFLKEISLQPVVIYSQTVLNRLNFMSAHRHILGIGSIIGMFSDENSIVWGSGIMDSKLKDIIPPYDIRAVRGPLTRNKLLSMGIDCPEVYGDPALLLPMVYTPKVMKKYKLGVIPHYSELENAKIIFRNRQDIHIIDMAHYNDYHEIINSLYECEGVLSSSLHGLILGEAYKVPSVWVEFAESKQRDRFKYHDFYASIGKDPEPVIISSICDIIQCKNALNEWVPGYIDLIPLIESAPFRININQN